MVYRDTAMYLRWKNVQSLTACSRNKNGDEIQNQEDPKKQVRSRVGRSFHLNTCPEFYTPTLNVSGNCAISEGTTNTLIPLKQQKFPVSPHAYHCAVFHLKPQAPIFSQSVQHVSSQHLGQQGNHTTMTRAAGNHSVLQTHIHMLLVDRQDDPQRNKEDLKNIEK